MSAWLFWLSAAAVAVVAEILVGTGYFLLLAAAFSGAALAAGFGADWSISLLAAALLSAVGLFWLYRRREAQAGKRPRDTMAENDLDLGETVLLGTMQADGLWRVDYRGTQWQARVQGEAGEGKAAEIVGKDGNILLLQIRQ